MTAARKAGCKPQLVRVMVPAYLYLTLQIDGAWSKPRIQRAVAELLGSWTDGVPSKSPLAELAIASCAGAVRYVPDLLSRSQDIAILWRKPLGGTHAETA